MSTQKALSLAEQRSRLERRANVIRSRLLRTIDALDNRRHQVQEIGHHAKRLAVPAVAAVVGVVVIGAGTTIAIRALVQRRRERSLSYRVNQALAPFRQPKRPPFWQEALRKLALTAIGILASELAKRGALGILNGRGPAALLPVHVDGHPAPAVPLATGPSAPLLGK
jgi:hypothetical protein